MLAQVRLAREGSKARRKVRAGLKRAEELIEETGAKSYAPFISELRAKLERKGSEKAKAQWDEAQRLYTETGAAGHLARLSEERPR